MAYLFKIRYSSFKKSFDIPSAFNSTYPITQVLCNVIASIEIESKNNDCDFYIVYHNISDFIGDNGIKRRHLFAQYIYLQDDKTKEQDDEYTSSYQEFLITQNNDRINDFCTEKDIYIDLINGKETEEFDKKNFSSLPMIHITTMDLFSIADNTSKCQKIKKAFIKQGIIVPRYIKYLDSSIWNQYVPFNKIDEDNYEFQKSLNQAIKKIMDCSDKGFYNDDKIKAIADFNARLLFNSHLESSLDKHGAYVAPFIFHSEKEMKQKYKKKYEKIKNVNTNKELEWRILLIDDNARKNNSITINRTGAINIRFVINRILEELNLKVTLKCVETVQKAQKELNNQRYDIILLDYLLDKKQDELGEREYGYELLHEIYEKFNDEDNKQSTEITKESILEDNSKGIFDKFWIMFISVFRNAVSGRLQEKGYTYDMDFWNITRGACPITTPELFKCNLLSFMNRQIEIITGISLNHNAQEQLKEHCKENKRIITLLDLLTFIYNDKLSKEREFACIFFNALLSIRKNYDVLKYDSVYRNEEKYGSPLVRSLFTDIDHYDNAFWEHLMHLVYLTAYGTIRQWPEMWEEYLFVKPYLDSAEEDDAKKMGKQIKKGDMISTAIESYIITLKNNSF
jgi:CheY-like chemotaxis protein